MKTALIAILSLLALNAHADYKNPSADVKAKVLAAALANKTIQAVLQASAADVGMNIKECKITVISIEGEIQNNQPSGAVQFSQNCSSSDGEAGSNTVIDSTMGYGAVYLDKVETRRSGV